MNLCDALLLDPDDDQNRCPAGPFRGADPFRCLRCGGWLGHGRLLTPAEVAHHTAQIVSLVGQVAADYPAAWDLAHHPTRRPQNGRSGSRPDPTGNSVADRRRARTEAHTLIVCRLVEQALRALRRADEAAGDALLASEPPGPAEHTKAAWHDSSPRLVGRPDLAEAYDAQDRRQAHPDPLGSGL